MSSKILNQDIVRKAVMGKFWEGGKWSLFSENARFEFPNAAPGMPQIMDGFEIELYFSWLSRTVKSWDVELEGFFPTTDPDVFWTESHVKAEVFWGGQNGILDTKRFARYELKDGKIILYCEVSNPLAWLRAAGRELPLFKIDLYHKDIEEALKNPAPEPEENKELDMSPEAINARIAGGLEAFQCENYWKATAEMAVYAPDMESKVWFLPPEMKEHYPEEMMPRLGLWSILSVPVFDFDRRGKVWETTEKGLYFCEYHACGETRWLGNGVDGHYRNRYFYKLRFDNAGRIDACEEILNPINKFNSINVSLPTFPYYF